MLDQETGTVLWQDGICHELDQLSSYCTFHDLGINGKPGSDYQKIKVRFIFGQSRWEAKGEAHSMWQYDTRT